VCHDQANWILPVPAVTVVTLKSPSVAVVDVRPPLGLEMVYALG
jgi:hypothetical protein